MLFSSSWYFSEDKSHLCAQLSFEALIMNTFNDDEENFHCVLKWEIVEYEYMVFYSLVSSSKFKQNDHKHFYDKGCLYEFFVLILSPDRRQNMFICVICIVDRSGFTITKMKQHTLQTIICQLVFVWQT